MARQDLHNYPDEYYYPEALRSGILTEAEMRKEYSYLRAIANKRLERFPGTEFEEHQSYRRNVGKFAPLSEISSKRDLIMKLYEVKKFTSAKSSSVTGLRAIERQALETARERGLTWLNKGNLKAFGEFMEEARARGYARLYGSERVAELFGTASKKDLDPQKLFEDFSYWMENQKELAATPKIKSPVERTAEQYREKLENKRNIKRR